MDENKERGKGKLEEIGGTLKETLGDVTGNERLQAEGEADKLQGQSRQEVAKGVGRAKGAGEELKGNLKQGLGNLTGDEQLQAEGRADELKGQARQDFNT
jgi:uncharacterized protein YjbJ (UPF0337 family)